MNSDSGTPNQAHPIRAPFSFLPGLRVLSIILLAAGFSACASNPETKMSGSLKNISQYRTLAILPVELPENTETSTADLFRQGMHAHLKESNFHVLERYIVDGLLKKHGLTDPAKFRTMNAMRFGEILGVDAVLMSRVNRVERSYWILHSSIEVEVSVKMVDTRNGEVLWWAKQTESDFQGLGKIPTGMTAAVLAPIYFVTNKLNLNRITTKLVNKLAAIVKSPESASDKKTFKGSVITAAATEDIKQIEEAGKRTALREQQAKPRSKPVRVNLAPARLAQDKHSTGRIKRVIYLSGPLVPANHIYSRMHRRPLSKVSKAKKQFPVPFQTAAVKPSLPRPGKKSGLFYTIQVGAYKTQAFAQKMFSALLQKGYNAFITPPTKQNKTRLYRVQVEKFADKSQAVKLAHQLKDQENLRNFVTTVKPG